MKLQIPLRFAHLKWLKRPLLEPEGFLVYGRFVFIDRQINYTCNYELLSVYCETCLHLTLINKVLLNLVKNEMELLRSFYIFNEV